MHNIKRDDLLIIEGGISVSGSFINSLTGGIKIILELGRSLGSALRRGSKRKLCNI